MRQRPPQARRREQAGPVVGVGLELDQVLRLIDRSHLEWPIADVVGGILIPGLTTFVDQFLLQWAASVDPNIYDPYSLKERFGDRLAFYGGISVQGGIGPPPPPTTGIVINAGDA